MPRWRDKNCSIQYKYIYVLKYQYYNKQFYRKEYHEVITLRLAVRLSRPPGGQTGQQLIVSWREAWMPRSRIVDAPLPLELDWAWSFGRQEQGSTSWPCRMRDCCRKDSGMDLEDEGTAWSVLPCLVELVVICAIGRQFSGKSSVRADS